MNENLDLCKILEGCEGIELYSASLGEDVTLVKIKSIDDGRPIVVRDAKGITWDFPRRGYVHTNYPNGECSLFPSKDLRDWNKFKKPIPIDTPMMCSSYSCVDEFRVAFYAGFIDGVHHCFMNGLKHSDSGSTAKWKYMIPYDKFDPNDIEESLKYNIQK